jgi:phosphopantothenoylcysteine decarboxylase/phosphopantothenate--cysteine ligase
MDLQGKKIVLGLSGGVACYKAAELCRALIKQGASVQVVMTDAATHFIGPVTMQALSGNTVWLDQWDARMPNNMAHIDLTRGADAVLVAPCSADFLRKLAHGVCDDLLSTLCLARPHGVPLLVAPSRCGRTRLPSATSPPCAKTASGCSARPPASRPAARSAWEGCWNRNSCWKS